MGSATSRILGTENPVEASLHHRLTNGVDFAAGAEGIGPQIPARSGHAYDNNFIGENARAHFGDVYNHSVTYEQPGFPNKDVISQSYKNFMSALSFHQMSFRFMAIDPAYVETSRWVLETAEFQKWRDRTLDSDSNIFWLKGKPGTGKSTIMKTMVKHLEGGDPKSIVLSFFFNARGQPLEQSFEGLYRTMLHQLFSKVPQLLEITETVQMYASCAHEPTWWTELLRGMFSDAVL